MWQSAEWLPVLYMCSPVWPPQSAAQLEELWWACQSGSTDGTKCPRRLSPHLSHTSGLSCHCVHMSMLTAAHCVDVILSQCLSSTESTCLLHSPFKYMWWKTGSVHHLSIVDAEHNKGVAIIVLVVQIKIWQWMKLQHSLFFITYFNRKCQRSAGTGSYAGADCTAGASD